MSAVRFLVADSSPALQTFTKNLLVSYGFEAGWIRTVASPQAALAAAREEAPHFLLTDYFSKSNIDGPTLHGEIKQIQPALRWALMGANMPADVMQHAKQHAALFVLDKPFGVHDMKTAMGRALEQWGQDNHEVGRRMPGYRRARAVPAIPVIPDTPTLSAGDVVDYQGTRDTVRYVIFRRGELVVQLDRTPGMIPATKLRKM